MHRRECTVVEMLCSRGSDRAAKTNLAIEAIEAIEAREARERRAPEQAVRPQNASKQAASNKVVPPPVLTQAPTPFVPQQLDIVSPIPAARPIPAPTPHTSTPPIYTFTQTHDPIRQQYHINGRHP